MKLLTETAYQMVFSESSALGASGIKAVITATTPESFPK